MTLLAVVFTAYLCPGTVTILGVGIPLARLPESAKPALAVAGVCEARPTLELYDPARSGGAHARVLALGKPAQMYALTQGVKISPPLVEWKTAADIKETP